MVYSSLSEAYKDRLVESQYLYLKKEECRLDVIILRSATFQNILQFDLLYIFKSLSFTFHTTVVSNFTKPLVSVLYIIPWVSYYGNDVHGNHISAFPSKGLHFTNSLYLQSLQNQISESCQLSCQQAFWNLVHTHWHSGSQWLIIILVHIFSSVS